MRSLSQGRRRSVDRDTYGPGIQPRKNLLRDADAVRRSGKPHSTRRYREVCWGPARSKTLCTHGSASHGNREIPFSPGRQDRDASGSPSTSPTMNEQGKSDRPAVPEKSPNKTGQPERVPDTAPDGRAQRAGAGTSGS